MDNYWYYTLSAIPQTLAAMIALAATFVVFKLNFSSEQIYKCRTDLARPILLLTSFINKEIHDIEPLSDQDFIQLYEEGLANIYIGKDNLGLKQELYNKLVKEMERIIHEEWKSWFRAKPQRIYGYLVMKKDILIRLIDAKKKSLQLLRLSLFLASLVIGVSLLILPYLDFLKIYFDPSLIVSIIMLGSLISVSFTAYSVWKIAVY